MIVSEKYIPQRRMRLQSEPPLWSTWMDAEFFNSREAAEEWLSTLAPSYERIEHRLVKRTDEVLS